MLEVVVVLEEEEEEEEQLYLTGRAHTPAETLVSTLCWQSGTLSTST